MKLTEEEFLKLSKKDKINFLKEIAKGKAQFLKGEKSGRNNKRNKKRKL